MCRMAHFGNCDPETADQEYCIFHKPNKTEEEAKEFYRKFLDRFEPRVEEIEVEGRKIKRLVFEKEVDASGYVFPRILDELSHQDKKGDVWEGRYPFSDALFNEGATFFSAIFEEDADFSESIFEGETDFSGAHFEKKAIFSLTTFKGKVDFIGARFEGPTEFIGATFEGEFNNFDEVVFSYYVQFEEAIFAHDVTLKTSTFKDAEFIATIFCGEADFTKATFEDTVTFECAYFGNDAIFDEVEFRKTARFSGALADYPEYLEYVLLGEVEGLEELKNIERLIERASQVECKIQPDHKFMKGLSFSNSEFLAINFVEFSGGDELSSEAIEWFESLFNSPHALAEAARVQRLSFEREEKRNCADKVFVLEMRAKRKIRLRNAQSKLEKFKAHTRNFIEWLLGDLPSEYGTNWVRLFLFSLLVIISNAILYTLWSTYIKGFPQTSSYLVRLANALYYSLVTFTTLGYGDMHPTGWLKALSALEALTGAVFMALIVAVIARKWMR